MVCGLDLFGFWFKFFDGYWWVFEEVLSLWGRLIDRFYVVDVNKGVFGSVGIKMNVVVFGFFDCV